MIEFLDLQKQQIEIKSAIEKRISSVLEHGKYILGPEVSELEEEYQNEVSSLTNGSSNE